MRGLKKIWQRALMATFAMIFSCSIIEEADITSSDELSLLKLTSFQIVQDTNLGSSTIAAKLNYDSVQNFTDTNTGTKIARKVEYSLPPLGNLKMKFRSNTTTSTRIFIYYTDTKKVYTLGVIQQDSVVERYRFRYNSTGQLVKITTSLNPIDNLPIKRTTNDTLLYESNVIKTLTRKENGVNTSYSITYLGGGDNIYVSKVSTNYNSRDGNCPNNNSSTTCTGYSNEQGMTGGGATPQITISATQIFDNLSRLSLQDQRVGFTNPSNTFNRQLDTFYFHPTMLLRNQLSQGNHLLVIYMLDWWLLGAASTGASFSRDDHVTINFDYER